MVVKQRIVYCFSFLILSFIFLNKQQFNHKAHAQAHTPLQLQPGTPTGLVITLPPPATTSATLAPGQTAPTQMPYYPEINPWVFIIPGIIIVLAVLLR